MNLKNKYTAQGFVEALLAILIGGMAVIALMSVSVRVLAQVTKNEINDQLTQEAVLGSNLMDYIIEYRNNPVDPSNPVDDYPPPLTLTNSFWQNARIPQWCYELDGDLSSPKIGTNSLCEMDSNGGINPKNCLSNWNVAAIDSTNSDDKRETLFRIMCVNQNSVIGGGSNNDVLILNIFTGTEPCREKNQSGMTDYRSEDDACIIVHYKATYPFEIIR